MKNFINFIGNLIKSGTEESSMRFAFISFTLSCILIILTISFIIIQSTIKGSIIDWSGIGIAIAAIGAAITAFATQKVAQKKVEQDNNKSAQ